MKTLIVKPQPKKPKKQKQVKGNSKAYKARSHTCAEILQDKFWNRITDTSRGEKLSILLEMNEIELWKNGEFRTWSKTREIFERNRAGLWTMLGSECFCHGQGTRAVHLHHIIPLNGGGTNISTNLVPLCFDCHSEIHPWL